MTRHTTRHTFCVSAGQDEAHPFLADDEAHNENARGTLSRFRRSDEAHDEAHTRTAPRGTTASLPLGRGRCVVPASVKTDA